MHGAVVVGCGFAGLFAAEALRRAPVEVVAVDRTNHHLFQPLLYERPSTSDDPSTQPSRKRRVQ